ncbi:LamG-like jellyroll fold domain-containing protein [Kitasatospora sp. NPDC054939]
MTAEFLDIMCGGLTPAYDRGAERLTVALRTNRDGTLHAVYDSGFQAYQRRWNRLPDSPRLLLAPRDATTEPLVVEVLFTRPPGSDEQHVTVRFPAGWPAGQATVVEPPGGAGLTHRVRLTRIRPLRPAPQAAADWEATVLLGNLAKLLWVIGSDYEDLTRRLAEVSAQRYAHRAHGASLDLIGRDLGAPRFPPRPHTWDGRTVALYHLDDTAAPGTGVTEVADAAARFGATPHHGRNEGALAGRTGRFSAAFEFTGTSSVTIDPDPAFDTGPDTSLTVEAVVRPARTVPAIGTRSGPGSEAGAVIAKRALLDSAASPGWSLTVGRFRGVDRNLRLSLADDAGRTVDLFADRDLGDGPFHHVAAVVERLRHLPGAADEPRPASVRLHLDGVEVARRRLDRLGALTNDRPVVLGLGREETPTGTTGAGFTGLLEEVRISRTARAGFDPVTGESDRHYRMRLELFQRWLVPTADSLRRALNRPGPDGEAQPGIELDETAGRPHTGTLELRILPRPLGRGQSITADGDQRATEAETVGTAEDEPDFDPGWLCHHEGRAGLDLGPDPGGVLMHIGVRDALDALLDRLVGLPGTLHVLRAHDPAATDVHRVGRALLLRHTALPAGELAVHAHAAGFGWVRHAHEGLVHAAQPPGPAFRILAGPPGRRVRVRDSVPLGLEPSPARLAGAGVRWSVTRSGPGEATVGQGVPAVLTAVAAGDVTVQVEVARAGHVRGGSLALRISPAADEFAPGGSIDRSGRTGVTEEQAAGPRTEDFEPANLLVRTDDLTGTRRTVDYGEDPAHRRMQSVTSRALDRLLDLLPANGRLVVAAGFAPDAAGLRAQGRALELRHTELPAGELAVLAFDAGFDYVKVARPDPPTGRVIEVAVAAGEPIEVRGPAELAVGESATVAAEPHASPVDACFTPDGARFHLSEPGSHRIATFTVAAGRPGDFPGLTFAGSTPVTPFPGPLALVGGRLYVAHGPGGSVSVLDPVTLAPTAPALVGPRPVALGTDGTRLYVAYAGDGTLRAYDPQVQPPAPSTATLPAAPRGLAVSASAPVLAVLLDGGRFCRLSRADLQQQGPVISTGTGTETLGAAFTPDGTKLYVARRSTGTGGGTVSVQVYPAGATTPSATIGGFPPTTVPLTLRAAPTGRHLYVATAGSDSAAGRVHVIDTTTDTLLPRALDPGGDCRALAVGPAAAPYAPCLLAAPQGGAGVLLADPAPLGQSPPRPPRLVSRQVLGPGGKRALSWSVGPSSPGRAAVASPTDPVTRVEGRAPGTVPVRASYLPGDGLRPYQCEVRLAGARDGDDRVVLSKDRYDLVLNILNWFHPIGVEFRTERLRAHVRELSGEEADTDVLPAYTFPTYHRSNELPSRSPARFLRPDKDDER